MNNNIAYRQRNTEGWISIDSDKRIDVIGKKTLCLKYREPCRYIKKVKKWGLILKYQQFASLRVMLNKISGYSHALIDDRHQRKAFHYITLYFNQEPTEQDIYCATAPLNLLKEVEGEALTIDDDKQPEVTRNDKFNFHMYGNELKEFLETSKNFSESDFDSKSSNNISVNEVSIHNNSESNDKSKEINKRNKDYSPLVIGKEESDSVKRFKASSKLGNRRSTTQNLPDQQIIVIIRNFSDAEVFTIDNEPEYEALAEELREIAEKKKIAKLCEEMKQLIRGRKKVKDRCITNLLD